MIFISRVETEIGIMVAGAVNEGLCLLKFENEDSKYSEYRYLEKQFNTSIEYGENDHLISVRTELTEYFCGTRRAFNIPIVMSGTIFQQMVWKELMKIPYGVTRSYLEQSRVLGNAKSVRAVATANSSNKITILIPCHRIIGSDGSLTGYSGGLVRKKWLLDHEKRYSEISYNNSIF
jgi:AraC family transcriptional regulator, regulatory protein of adaptative response / methylated-DNA-[protein]-cysteine methyltransferase